jgi:phage tail-like protein
VRGLVVDLEARQSLLGSLPGLYQEDDLARALVAAFDASLAAVVSTIDNFPAYLDPALTPDDFLDWLAGWVGLLPDETWPLQRRRALVAVASQVFRRRGTAAGLAMHLKLLTAGEVEVTDSGGVSWSRTPGTAAPGDDSYSVAIRVKPPKKETLDAARLEAIVATATPAHVSHAITIGDRPTP